MPVMGGKGNISSKVNSYALQDFLVLFVKNF